MFAHLQYRNYCKHNIGESKETSFVEREISNMNRGAMQSSPVQQITAGGNPNWWNINTMLPPSHHFPPPIPTTNFNFIPPQSPSPFSPPSWPLDNDYNAHTTTTTTTPLQHQTPAADFWTQLFMGGLASEEEKAAAVAAAAAAGLINHFPEHHHSSCGFLYGNNNNLMAANSTTATPTFTTSSPHSCITSFGVLEISPTTTTTTNTKSDQPPPPLTVADPTPECNSSAGNGGSVKKAKVQSTATQFKVRKFGDRITTLHQLVSPFGKTDTASVLLEAIGYVRFLQSQIEALSLPYLSSGSGNNKRQQLQQHPQSVQGKRNCIFPDHEDPGQLLNDICLKRKGGPDQEEAREDLRSRGLCLVPISWTLHVGRDNGADYWAPVLGGFQ